MQLNRERRLIFLRKDVVVRRLQTPGGYARASLLAGAKICGAVASLSTAWIRLNATGWSLRGGAENLAWTAFVPLAGLDSLKLWIINRCKKSMPAAPSDRCAGAMYLGAFPGTLFHPGAH